ncbi:signal peptidase I [Nocardioides sp. SLBN-35]|uniref:signal peptidase I n=1 Tax=Nocardioides sp. SLBN-35 TaxID=2768445 RepID=UPI00114F55A8|nr:signal peptidase I [Nocardioides sp. SLBN-35]TQK71476.1 signal peptidase I [Nocardioides sp. SLBN-35]
MTRVRDVLLTVGAVLGALCLVLTLAGLAFGVKALVFRSGSMGPEIPAGSVGITRPAAAGDLKVGDVVSVISADRTRITHRIVAIDGSGATRRLTLQGDANPVPDAETYPVRRADRLVLAVPVAGYVLAWLGSPLGLFLLGAMVTGLLAVILRPRRPGGRRRAGVLAAAPLAAAVVAATSTGTAASFTDTAAATSGGVVAHTVTSQAAPACQDLDGLLVLGNIARVTWSQVSDRYEYAWELRTTGGTVVASGTVGAGTATGGTVTIDVTTGLIGVNANYSLVIRARLTGTTTWVAASTTTTQVRRVSILIIGAAMRCGWA